MFQKLFQFSIFFIISVYSRCSNIPLLCIYKHEPIVHIEHCKIFFHKVINEIVELFSIIAML